MKPENFAVSGRKSSKMLYIIDYGLAKLYRDPNTHLHIPSRDNKRFLGTARYASLYTHLGVEQSRRDDMESLGYIFVYLLKGKLPWQGIKMESRHERYNAIKEKKQEMTVEELCSDLPLQFLRYMRFCRKLKFEEKPDYAQLRMMFKNLFYERSYDNNFAYDWVFLDALSEVKVPISINTNGTNQASISGTNIVDGIERNYLKIVKEGPKFLEVIGGNVQSGIMSTNKSTFQPEPSKHILDTDIENLMEESKGEAVKLCASEQLLLPGLANVNRVIENRGKWNEVVDSSSCDFRESEIVEHANVVSKGWV